MAYDMTSAAGQSDWTNVAEGLKAAIGQAAHARWIAPLTFVSLDNGIGRFAAPSGFVADYVERTYAEDMLAVMRAARMPVERVVVTAAPQGARAEVLAEAPEEPASAPIDARFTFETFVVGKPNELAHAAARRVAEGETVSYNPVFLHGGVGLGKTHLLQAICLQILDERPGSTIYYTSCEGFMTQFIDAVQAGQMAEFRHRFRDLDVLVIDDIHFLAKRDRTQEEFFHTFNSLYQAGKQIVLSSDAPPNEIPDLEQRLVSRFQSGLVVPVNPPCYETRVQIVKQKARLRGLEFSDDVACFIAATVNSNIRELEGAITSVQMLHITDQKPITESLARLALHDPSGDMQREITIDDIIEIVVDHFGIKLTDLQSKRRQKSIAHPRQVCMYLARAHTRYSLEEIGGYFGGRDHTTVMHAQRTVTSKRANDADLDRVLASLEQRLGVGETVSSRP
jgi:chromosomal replication initiator protein